LAEDNGCKDAIPFVIPAELAEKTELNRIEKPMNLFEVRRSSRVVLSLNADIDVVSFCILQIIK